MFPRSCLSKIKTGEGGKANLFYFRPLEEHKSLGTIIGSCGERNQFWSSSITWISPNVSGGQEGGVAGWNGHGMESGEAPRSKLKKVVSENPPFVPFIFFQFKQKVALPNRIDWKWLNWFTYKYSEKKSQTEKLTTKNKGKKNLPIQKKRKERLFAGWDVEWHGSQVVESYLNESQAIDPSRSIII